MFGQALPRHLEIVREIDRRFIAEVRGAFPGDEARARRMAVVDEGSGGRVRMAHLATVGSRSVNGVASLHSRLLQETVLSDFHALWPERFSNKTNGVSHRRFLLDANPELTALISDAIGDSWTSDLAKLRRLEPFAQDAPFREEWRRVKRLNKVRLAAVLGAATDTAVDPDSLFDVQVKRIHEYKRQHLNVLHVLTLYARLLARPEMDVLPRTFVFAGKAAPGYHMAKRIVKLIHAVAGVVNGDPAVRGRLGVVFLPDFNVKNAQRVYPAADLSEQISTAGKEASGTGNMKFAMNGALTIGTLDGANVEIREDVGAENFFLFGLDAAEVVRRRAGGYRPLDEIDRDDELREVLELIADGRLSGGDPALFEPIVHSLRTRDEFFLMADYRAYVDCQQRVSDAFRDKERWTRMSILNVARVGRFTSDRAIREYCDEIWEVEPVTIAEGAPHGDGPLALEGR
jgi:starch phosphorylase